MRTATVTALITAIAHTGNGFTLAPGAYEVVEIDGADERGFVAIIGPIDGEILLINPRDPNVTVEVSR